MAKEDVELDAASVQLNEPAGDELFLSDALRIVRRIGRGGLGEVYEAEHLLLNRKVAVKVLLEAGSAQHAERFRREAQAAAALVHMNIACVRDFGVSADGREFLVMDFVDGEPLSTYLSRVKRIPQAEVVELALQIARGLQHAHQHKVIHRDVKPSNLMLTRGTDGQLIAKVVDFGIAQFLSNEETSRLTMTGEIVGTPYYMSPEQATGEVTDGRTDIYSFGCVLYEMLSGAPPFTGDNHLAVMTQHLHKTAPPLESSLCSKQLNKLIAICLSKNVGDRYTSFEEVLADLEHIKKGEQLSPGRKDRRTSWSTVLVSAGLLMSLLATIYMIYYGSHKPAALQTPTVEAPLTVQASSSADFRQSALRAIRLMNQGKFNEARVSFEDARSKAAQGSYQLLRVLENLYLIARLNHDSNEESKLRNEVRQVAKQAESHTDLNHAIMRERQETLELLPDKLPEKDRRKLTRLATDINDVAGALLTDRHSAQAEDLLHLLIKKLESNLPSTRKSLEATYVNLSNVLESQQKFTEACHYMDKAISLDEALDGEASPSVAQNLAVRARMRARNRSIIEAQADIERAKKIILSVSQEKSKQRIETDLDYALAEIAFQKSNVDESIALLKKCRIRYNQFGDIDLAKSCLSRELILLQLRNQFTQAEELMLGVIEEIANSQPLSLELADAQELLADLYYRQSRIEGKTKLAIPYYESCMEIRQLQLSPENAVVEDSILRFASAAGSSAQPLLDRVISVHEMDKREDATYLRAVILSSYAQRRTNVDESQRLFAKGFKVILRSKDSSLISQQFFELASTFWKPTDANWKLLENFLLQVKKKNEQEYGQNSIQAATSLELLGLLFFSKEDAEKAVSYLQEARKRALACARENSETRWRVAGIINSLARASRYAGLADWTNLLEESDSIRYEPGH